MKGSMNRSNRSHRDGRGEKGWYCSSRPAGTGANQNCPYRGYSRQGVLQPLSSFVSGFFRHVQQMIEREVERVRIGKAERLTLPEERKKAVPMHTATVSRKQADLVNPEKTATGVKK